MIIHTHLINIINAYIVCYENGFIFHSNYGWSNLVAKSKLSEFVFAQFYSRILNVETIADVMKVNKQ